MSLAETLARPPLLPAGSASLASFPTRVMTPPIPFVQQTTVAGSPPSAPVAPTQIGPPAPDLPQGYIDLSAQTVAIDGLTFPLTDAECAKIVAIAQRATRRGMTETTGAVCALLAALIPAPVPVVRRRRRTRPAASPAPPVALTPAMAEALEKSATPLSVPPPAEPAASVSVQRTSTPPPARKRGRPRKDRGGA